MAGIEEKNVEISFKCFGSQELNDQITLVTNACCSRDLKQAIVGVCFVGQDLTAQKMITDKYTKAKGDYASIIRSPCALIPPIFMMDEYGKCLEWNDAMVKLTGLPREEASNKMLLGEVFTLGNFGCRVKSDMLTRLRILLNEVISGLDPDKLSFGFFDPNGKYVEGLLSANKRVNGEGKVTGVLCFLQVTSPELQHAMLVQRMSEQAALNSLTKVCYLKHELKNGLNGIQFIDDLMESELCGEQKHILHNSYLCREQLAQIVDDSDIESIEQWYGFSTILSNFLFSSSLYNHASTLTTTCTGVLEAEFKPETSRGTQTVNVILYFLGCLDLPFGTNYLISRNQIISFT